MGGREEGRNEGKEEVGNERGEGERKRGIVREQRERICTDEETISTHNIVCHKRDF